RRALIVLVWRAGLRISEALALLESDLDRVCGAVLVGREKGGKRREVGIDRWAWDPTTYPRLARSRSRAMGGNGTCLVVNAQLVTPARMSCKETVDEDGCVT